MKRQPLVTLRLTRSQLETLFSMADQGYADGDFLCCSHGEERRNLRRDVNSVFGKLRSAMRQANRIEDGTDDDLAMLARFCPTRYSYGSRRIAPTEEEATARAALAALTGNRD